VSERARSSQEHASGEHPALDIRDLVVRYDKRVAVDRLTLTVRAGEIVGLLGPNGAGKSTALAAVAGAIAPAGGTITVGGADLAREPLAARSRVGFADQPPALYDFFTVAEHVAFIAESRAGGRAGDAGGPGKGGGNGGAAAAGAGADPDGQRALLADLGLAGVANRLCRELSFGMRQRVGLAAALVGGARVVLLDETLNGLDPRAAVTAREVLTRAAAGGAAVVLSTHLLGVAERLCQRIIIIDQGQLKVDLSGDELRSLIDRGPGAIEDLYLAEVADADPT
jgi:ABC-2 type transport system ATP-binding protein